MKGFTLCFSTTTTPISKQKQKLKTSTCKTSANAPLEDRDPDIQICTGCTGLGKTGCGGIYPMRCRMMIATEVHWRNLPIVAHLNQVYRYIWWCVCATFFKTTDSIVIRSCT
jgi:L-cystine uptake protein TcyP (sodium:dicarboxylate symporter family)